MQDSGFVVTQLIDLYNVEKHWLSLIQKKTKALLLEAFAHHYFTLAPLYVLTFLAAFGGL